MNKLTKSDISLGEVRNRVSPSMEEYEMLLLKMSALSLDEEISGNISTLNNDPKVELRSGQYIIDLDKVKKVTIQVDQDNRALVLVGGLQGRPVTFEFLNKASHDISWINLRVSGGLSPGLSIVPKNSNAKFARTIYEIIRLGDEYYLLNQLHEI